MKLGSLSMHAILEDAEKVIWRFPLPILIALAATIIGLVSINADNPEAYFHILMTLVLGFPLLISATLVGEQHEWAPMKKGISYLFSTILLLAYYTWFYNSTSGDVLNLEFPFFLRSLLWAIGLVLLVTFVPFWKKNVDTTPYAFWNYVKTLVFSLIVIGIFAGIIQAGISLALASIGFLFDIQIPPQRYAEIAVVIWGFLVPMLFLSRIPRDFQQTTEPEQYPKELRIVSQYVLVPLVALYFVILYAYAIRIVAVWEWPTGMLASMILGFSLLGILVYAILYPLRTTTAWIRKIGTIFFIVLIPQIGMLFWALWFRISEYGFTESRYYVFVSGLWLAATALYFLKSARKDIRILPISLFFIAVLTSFGPWGALAVSERSQLNRFEALLVKNNLLVAGKVQKATAEVSIDDSREISAIVAYIDETHGLKRFQPYVAADLSALDGQRWDRPAQFVKEYIGIDYGPGGSPGQDESFYYHTDGWQDTTLNISGYRYMLELEKLFKVGSIESDIDGVLGQFRLDANKSVLSIVKNGITIARVDLKPLLDELSPEKDPTNLSQERMKITLENDAISLVLYIRHTTGTSQGNDKYEIHYLNGFLLFSLK